MSITISSRVSRYDFLGRLHVLPEVEGELIAGGVVPQSQFIRQGYFLAQAGASARALPRSLVGSSLVPAWRFRRLAKLAREWVRGNIQQLISGACLIEARPHWQESGIFRAFYLEPRSTIKLAIGSDNGRRRVERELVARQVAGNVGCVRIPEIYALRDTPDCIAFHEEWIDGRAFRRHRDMKTVCDVLLPQLGRHYETYGISEMPLEQAVGPEFTERVAEAAELSAWPSGWMERKKFLAVVRRLEQMQLALPVSFCHGDLAMCHVLFDRQNAPIVIDWDGGREAPIATDLEKMNRYMRPYSRRFLRPSLKLLGGLSRPEHYSPHAQLVIMALRSAAKHTYCRDSQAADGRQAIDSSPIRRKFRFIQWLLRQDDQFR